MLARRTLLVLLGSFALVACSSRERPGVQPEHFFLITVEGLRADHVHSLGYHRPTTDFQRPDESLAMDLDWLAEGGVQFAGALAASSDPRAATATVLTGASPLVHGVLGDGRALPADLPTLAEEFAAAGFRCAAYVSASQELAAADLARGFEHYEATTDDHRALQALAADLNAAADDDRPRFWWLHLSGPQQPWSPAPIATGPDFRSRYLDGREPGRVEETAEWFAALRAGDVQPNGAERDRLVALYDCELERVDFLLRRGFEALATRGGDADLLSRSAVLVTGTNGVELGERPGAWDDRAGIHEESLHVPLILRHPGSITGRRLLDGVVEHADIAPTVRELFDLGGLREGERSLLARTDSYEVRPFPARPALALVATPEGGLSLSARLGDDRLVLPYLGAVALYDLHHDPSQRHDLSGDLPERTRDAANLVFDALLAIRHHPDWDGDGREFLLRTLYAVAERGSTD